MDFCCYNSSEISTKSFRTRYTFCTECVDSAILLPLTVINTNITMVISKNQLLLRDTLKHCNFWACQFSVPRRYKPKFYQSVYKLYQWIEEGLKCMEPLEQNLALFSFLSYNIIVTKLDKIIEKSHVLNKVNGAMFEKA